VEFLELSDIPVQDFPMALRHQLPHLCRRPSLLMAAARKPCCAKIPHACSSAVWPKGKSERLHRQLGHPGLPFEPPLVVIGPCGLNSSSKRQSFSAGRFSLNVALRLTRKTWQPCFFKPRRASGGRFDARRFSLVPLGPADLNEALALLSASWWVRWPMAT